MLQQRLKASLWRMRSYYESAQCSAEHSFSTETCLMSNMMADFVYYRFFVGIEGLCFVSSLVVPGVFLVARPERYPVFKKAIDKPISDHEF